MGEERGPRQRQQVAPIPGGEVVPAWPHGLPGEDGDAFGDTLWGLAQPAQDPDPDGADRVLSPMALKLTPAGIYVVY